MISKRYRTHFISTLVVAGLLNVALYTGLLHVQQDKLIDLLFTKKDRPAEIVIVAIDDASIRSIGQWPWPRAVFGEIIKHLDGAAVISIDVNFKEFSRLGFADDNQLVTAIKKTRTPVVLNAEINDRGDPEMPIAILVREDLQAFPNLTIEADGVARRISVMRDNFPAVSLKLAQVAEGVPDRAETFRIHYQGPEGTFAHIPATDVLSGSIPGQFFKDKIVLVGATARDLQDFHETPFGIMSGVEIQANITQTLLEASFFSHHRSIDGFIIFFLAFITAWICFRSKGLTQIILGVMGTLVVYNLVVFWMFDYLYILDLLYPNLAILITGVVCITLQYLGASQERKFIQETFSRYVAPEVVEKLIADTSKLKLGGEKKIVSILFSDIRDFTVLSENMEPEMLSKFLNRYFTLMTDIVLARKGVVDKYIGDAVMAFWGAPLDNSHHAHDAVMAALDMIDALKTFNDENRSLDLPTINIGIGINSGEVTVGNMGSEKRFDYTVIGDNVNLASRLEGLNKIYGTNILTTQATKGTSDLEGSDGVFKEIDRVKVKGRNQEVTIFEVIPRYRHKEDIDQETDHDH